MGARARAETIVPHTTIARAIELRLSWMAHVTLRLTCDKCACRTAINRRTKSGRDLIDSEMPKAIQEIASKK